MRNETLTYQVDGLTMLSQLYYEESNVGRRPGVLVFPEADGLGEHAKAKAARLAQLGYVALACDLHGNGRIIDDFTEVMAIVNSLVNDPRRIRARAQAGLNALVARAEVNSSQLAAIGFCLGGMMALESARSGAPLRAVVGFHARLATAAPNDAKNIRGKVLICVGADDPFVPPEQRAEFEREMREGGVDWQMHLYGGVVHSFTNPQADGRGRPESVRYDARADARSWAAMRALFDEVFKD
jgi:dienelactone hydrolase